MDIVTLALSKKYTNARLENLATTGFTPVVVDVLPEPTQANSGNLYLVPANDPKDENKYLEYLVVENRWECIGSTAIDLGDYAKKSEAVEMIMFSTRDTKEARKAKFLHAIELFKANKPFDARFYCPYGVAVLDSKYTPSFSHTAFLFDMDFERKGWYYKYVLTFILEQRNESQSGIGYAEIQLMSTTADENCEYSEQLTANTSDTNYYLPVRNEIVTKLDIENPFFITSPSLHSSVIQQITHAANLSQWESLTFILSGESLEGHHGVYKFYTMEFAEDPSTGMILETYKYKTIAPTGTDTITSNGLTQGLLTYSIITIELNENREIANYSISDVQGDSLGYYLNPEETESFQPDTDNAPANKKYVDNAISNAVDEAGQAFANYYTKEEVEQLIAQAVAQALGTTEAALDEIIEGGE